MNRKDTFRHQGMRNQLVEMLKEKGIQSSGVLNAILEVPRHLFIDIGMEDHAYQDKAFPIAAEQTISNPYTVAFQSELLNISKGNKILEIGTGSGYQTAILILLGAKVYTIERQKELYTKTSSYLPKMGYNPESMIYGDGYEGLVNQSPFDGILVTAGAPEVPKKLLAQLKIGGKLVVPIGNDSQIMTLFIRHSEKDFEKKTFGEFRFVPMLEDCEDSHTNSS